MCQRVLLSALHMRFEHIFIDICASIQKVDVFFSRPQKVVRGRGAAGGCSKLFKSGLQEFEIQMYSNAAANCIVFQQNVGRLFQSIRNLFPKPSPPPFYCIKRRIHSSFCKWPNYLLYIPPVILLSKQTYNYRVRLAKLCRAECLQGISIHHDNHVGIGVKLPKMLQVLFISVG